MILAQVWMLPSMQVLRHAHSPVQGARRWPVSTKRHEKQLFWCVATQAAPFRLQAEAAWGDSVDRKACSVDTNQTRKGKVP
jgi:hypothetical protein